MRIKTIARAVAILQEFAPDRPVLGITELSRRLDLEKSTVQRLAASLRDCGLLDQDQVSGKYRLGLGLLELAGTMLKSWGFPELVRLYLRYLTDLVGESTYLGVLDRGGVVEIEDIPSREMIQHSGWTGRRLPLHCTSSGKVLMATMPPEAFEQALSTLDLKAFTPKTITDLDELREELAQARQQGYATDFEEYAGGTNAVAVALSLSGNARPAAVGVVGPTFRFNERKVLECVDALRAVGREISTRFAQSFA